MIGIVLAHSISFNNLFLFVRDYVSVGRFPSTTENAFPKLFPVSAGYNRERYSIINICVRKVKYQTHPFFVFHMFVSIYLFPSDGPVRNSDKTHNPFITYPMALAAKTRSVITMYVKKQIGFQILRH